MEEKCSRKGKVEMLQKNLSKRKILPCVLRQTTRVGMGSGGNCTFGEISVFRNQLTVESNEENKRTS